MLLQLVPYTYTYSNNSALKGKIMFLAFSALARSDYRSFLVPTIQPSVSNPVNE